MVVASVQQNNSSSMFSYAKYIGIGAFSGFVLKQAIPITKSEKDDSFNADRWNIRTKVKAAKAEEIVALKKSQNHSVALDTFLSLHDNKKLRQSEFEKFPSNLAGEVKEIFSKLKYKTKDLILTHRKNLIATTKGKRSASTFMILGGLTGLIISFIREVLPNKSNQS